MKLYRGMALVAMALLALSAAGQANVLTVDETRPGGVIVFGDFTARLTGLEVPDLDHPLGQEIWDFINGEIQGERVRVSTWTINNLASGIVYDENGHAFVTIEYGEIGSEKKQLLNLNEILLKKGYARVDEKYLPSARQYYQDLQKEAQDSEMGIWAK